MTDKLPTALVLGCLLWLNGAGSTLAAPANDPEASEATALTSAKITLSQAISAAEQQTGGRAYEAGLDVKAGAPRIVVETIGPKGVQTVTVDGRNGRLVGMHAGGERD